MTAPRSTPQTSVRAGFVVLAGLPNAGKSSLANAMVGERLSIVTPRAQTTRQRVLGIRTEATGDGGGAQMVLVDTPGVVTGGGLFDRSMMLEARRAVDEGDVVVAVVDGAARRGRGGSGGGSRRRGSGGAGRRWDALGALVQEARAPVVVAANKRDVAGFDSGEARGLARSAGGRAVAVSARTGAGLDELLDAVRAELPEGPFLYPEDDLASAPTRFFVQELVRESVLERYREEIPHSVAVRVEEFREAEDPVYIAASLHVERKSQKGVLIGRRGVAIKGLGSAARAKVEHFLGRRVYLDLWVKVTRGWRRRRRGLAMFGYAVPDGE